MSTLELCNTVKPVGCVWSPGIVLFAYRRG